MARARPRGLPGGLGKPCGEAPITEPRFPHGMATALRRPTTARDMSPLDAAVARVRAADDFPAVSGKIQQLMEVLQQEETHVQRLANLIIQDYSLTLKL